jgi:predicted ester cyclase
VVDARRAEGLQPRLFFGILRAAYWETTHELEGEHMPDNKAIVLNYIDRVWHRHDYSAIDEMIVPNYIQHAPNVPPGREGVRTFFKMVDGAFSDVTYTVDDAIAEGEKLVLRWTLRGRHTGPFQGLPPTNKDFALTGISIVKMEDGKLAENWVEQDLAGLMAQLRP